ncbi:uncharacterized protein KD926_005228 [Aspergillus affinis]|uniref:uncharacterized protein n=1 Tax=Aspergillus affinis TaxID=1070780 RepID=UPI0022FE6C4F|nr:uncharacterized protein KD926_005228 [Aspergillus affinis]KAI9042622.1 hypothetical protein KD926_005228 [Aspergillus affinis]
MSQISSVSGPAADDALLRSDSHAILDKKRPRVEDESTVDGRDPVRPRPLSWNPSAPVEPPLKSTQLRPIGVQSILNPPAKPGSITAAGPAEASREALGEQASVRASHQRLPSSPSVHLPSPSLHARRLSASPGMRNRQMSTPLSPSARFVNAGAGLPGKLSASQSPLAHESRPGLYSATPTSPMPLESVPGQAHSVPVHQQPVSISMHSTPTFHSRRTSAAPTPNLSPQETSPTTPISSFSQFGRSSPSLNGMSGPPPAPPFIASSSLSAKDPVPRLPSVVSGTRHVGDDAVTAAAATNTTTATSGQTENVPLPGMIPCILDLKSGSSSQAEKRKANSDASRRFRNRKRNEMQMEQKITAQQEEIRKQAETLQRQNQEIRTLMQERDHYRSERDFYREQASRLGPAGQGSSRPASPRAFRSSVENTPSERDHYIMRRVGDAPTGPLPSSSNTPPLASARMPGGWTSASSQYPSSAISHAERGVLADEHQAKSLSQYPGTWARS